MRSLFASGVSSVQIGNQFECTHDTVLYFCGRIKGKGKYTTVEIGKATVPLPKPKPHIPHIVIGVKSFRAKPALTDYKKVLAKSLQREPIVDEYGTLRGWKKREVVPSVANTIKESFHWA